MPDFTYEVFYHCDSAEHFQTKVEGSKGKKYTVRFGVTPHGPYEYDYSCTCDSFKFGRGKYCKHIEIVKKSDKHCNWLQFVEGGQPIEKDGHKACPKCGSEVHVRRWAV